MCKKYLQKGFTLLELLVTIAIIAILLSLAAPSFNDALARSAGRGVVADFQESFYFAQSEAMRLQNTVELCASTDGANCNGASFEDGWIILEIVDPSDSTKNVVLRDTPPPATQGLEIESSGNRTSYQFNGAGRIVGYVGNTLTFKVKRNGRTVYERKLGINTEGRIRNED